MSKLDLHFGDCMKAMREMEDNQFDLAIVDPPYGIGVFTSEMHTDRKTGKRRKNRNDFSRHYKWNEKIPSNEYFYQVQRVSTRQIIWGSNYYNCFSEKGGALVWYKGEMASTVSHAEIASLSFQKKVDFVRIDWQGGFIRKQKIVNQIHPCQKPVELYHHCLKNYAKEGDTILDTHLGSMSIAIACHDLGFDLTGYELDEDYYKAGIKRVKQHVAQGQLFQPEVEKPIQTSIEYKH